MITNNAEENNTQSCQTAVMVSADLVNKIHNENCLETLKRIPDASIDLILTDPPYGVTKNIWDKAPDLSELWIEWERVIKPNGAVIITAQQPFSTDVICSNRTSFIYDLIWEKSRTTGFLNANKMPLRCHEHILVFYKELPNFNPQKTKGNPNHVTSGKMANKSNNNNYGDFKQVIQHQTENKFPRSVLYFEQNDPNAIIHPTQKSLDLFRWIVKSYSNENDIVFDGYMGSGTTAVACVVENRKYIGSELNEKYYNDSIKRIEVVASQTSLFTGS